MEYAIWERSLYEGNDFSVKIRFVFDFERWHFVVLMVHVVTKVGSRFS